jgi:dipeptidyl aminopeptidase/acylaminoacyl peptidase
MRRVQLYRGRRSVDVHGRRGSDISCAFVLYALALSWAVAAGAQGAVMPSRPVDVDAGDVSPAALVEATDVTRLQLSPDGLWVLYKTERASIQEHRYITRSWAVRWSGGVPYEVPNDAVFESANGEDELVTSELDSTGYRRRALAVPGLANHSLPLLPIPERATGLSVSPDRKWAAYCVSPKDTVAPVSRDTMVDHAFEADSAFEPWDLSNGGLGHEPDRLYRHAATVCSVVDLTKPGIQPTAIQFPGSITPALPIRWLANSRALLIRGYSGAFLGEFPNLGLQFFGTMGHERKIAEFRVFVVDPAVGRAHASGAANTGWDAGAPVVSPDDRWYASIDFDSSSHLAGRRSLLAIARVGDSSRARTWHLPQSDTLAVIDRVIGWAPGQHEVRVAVEDRGTSLYRTRIVGLTPATGRFRELMADWSHDFGYLRQSSDGRRAVAVMRRPGELPKIVAIDLRSPNPVPRVLVTGESINPSLAAASALAYDSISAMSPDGKYTIASHVILPPGFDPTGHHGRYPLLVFRAGGPGAVRLNEWRGSDGYPLLTFASRGYIVLLPNPRNVDSRIAERDLANYVASSFTDVMAVVETAVARYPVDGARLGIVGGSYGGILSAYAISHTDRFRAASIGEGTVWTPLWLGVLHSLEAQSARYSDAPQVDPWSSIGRSAGDNNTPLLSADRVRTPNLVETGVATHGTLFPLGASPWVDTMRWFHIPVEWWVYPRSGHGWSQDPALLLDSYERNIAWFEYWLRDRPYPDQAKQARYDRWRHERALAGDARWEDRGADAQPGIGKS